MKQKSPDPKLRDPGYTSYITTCDQTRPHRPIETCPQGSQRTKKKKAGWRKGRKQRRTRRTAASDHTSWVYSLQSTSMQFCFLECRHYINTSLKKYKMRKVYSTSVPAEDAAGIRQGVEATLIRYHAHTTTHKSMLCVVMAAISLTLTWLLYLHTYPVGLSSYLHTRILLLVVPSCKP